MSQCGALPSLRKAIEVLNNNGCYADAEVIRRLIEDAKVARINSRRYFHNIFGEDQQPGSKGRSRSGSTADEPCPPAKRAKPAPVSGAGEARAGDAAKPAASSRAGPPVSKAAQQKSGASAGTANPRGIAVHASSSCSNKTSRESGGPTLGTGKGQTAARATNSAVASTKGARAESAASATGGATAACSSSAKNLAAGKARPESASGLATCVARKTVQHKPAAAKAKLQGAFPVPLPLFAPEKPIPKKAPGAGETVVAAEAMTVSQQAAQPSSLAVKKPGRSLEASERRREARKERRKTKRAATAANSSESAELPEPTAAADDSLPPVSSSESWEAQVEREEQRLAAQKELDEPMQISDAEAGRQPENREG